MNATASLAILAAYLLGAVPFGLLLVRFLTGLDLRQVGSGNIGATNAARAAGHTAGLVVFALDCAKGAVAVRLFAPLALGQAAWIPSLQAGRELALLQVACGGAAVLGHCFPVYLRFRGGKGVATGCGALAAIDPWIVLAGGGVWLLGLLATRYVSLASLLMGLAFPLAAWFRGAPQKVAYTLGAALLAALIWIRHRSNISRILAGSEPKAFRKRAPPGAGPVLADSAGRTSSTAGARGPSERNSP
jgi:glycerol-3-phosphate acyltransferase PlsY